MSASSSSLSTTAPQVRTSTVVHLPPLVSAKKQVCISNPKARIKQIIASQDFQRLPAIALEAVAYFKRKAKTAKCKAEAAKKELAESQASLFATQLEMKNLNRIIEKQNSEITCLQSSLQSISKANIEKMMAQIKREPEFKS
jgi:hypothetical protein